MEDYVPSEVETLFCAHEKHYVDVPGSEVVLTFNEKSAFTELRAACPICGGVAFANRGKSELVQSKFNLPASVSRKITMAATLRGITKTALVEEAIKWYLPATTSTIEVKVAGQVVRRTATWEEELNGCHGYD